MTLSIQKAKSLLAITQHHVSEVVVLVFSWTSVYLSKRDYTRE